MGAYLQSLKRFQVSTEVTGERVLADGSEAAAYGDGQLDVERPNRIRAHMQTREFRARDHLRRQDGDLYLFPRRSITRRWSSPGRSVS